MSLIETRREQMFPQTDVGGNRPTARLWRGPSLHGKVATHVGGSAESRDDCTDFGGGQVARRDKPGHTSPIVDMAPAISLPRSEISPAVRLSSTCTPPPTWKPLSFQPNACAL